jgi:hypothetical protein
VPQDVFPELIRRWADTLASRNLGGHMALYSSRLSRFNSSVNPTREAVRSQKQQAFARMGGARNLQLQNLRVLHPAGADIASATFTTTWTEGGARRSARYRLTFRRAGQNWLIHSEERLG